MRYFFVLLFAILVFTGCTRSRIEFTGTAPGIQDGVFLIKDLNNATICKSAIKAEKFALDTTWQEPGYYLMQTTNMEMGTQVFDVYLEPGKYTITTNKAKPFEYPAIQSTSKVQNELTAYYHLSSSLSEQIHKKVQDITASLNNAKAKSLPSNSGLAAKLIEAQQQETNLSLLVLNTFADKYPHNQVLPHIMLNMDYQENTAGFNRVYEKLSPETKNSASGKLMAHWLKYYMAKPPHK